MKKNIFRTKILFKNKKKNFTSFSKKELLFYSKNMYKRINFHKNLNDANQESIIYQNKNSFYPAKKYLYTDQSFLILKGKILILLFNDSGRIIKKFVLDKNNFFFRVKKNIFHQDIPMTKNTIHFESNNNSFNQRKIVFLKRKTYKKIIKKYANQK